MKYVSRFVLVGLCLSLAVCVTDTSSLAQKKKQGRIPHGQSKMPGPPLSPKEAIAKMTVPEGFSVELVASEPNIVNPVAMTFDEKGRIWITESLEYPRYSAGPGRDRIKVLEDTDGDGRADKFTVFAEGLNIPSGIAVGHGGVWVANSPDILFLQDTDGDGKADTRKVIVTGFGRRDTHELPNSLTWGPDGWLYGLNGVFNPCHVRQDGKDFEFTCALFRIHPKTHEFQLFAEGTSNPWGIAIDTEGAFFLSACVIDHLWHLAESGYYHRQGGPYPPFTWKLGSIVKHKHQQRAYCGITYFDSDAYPEKYRERLYMGNIHGNCINTDVLQRDGSTYFATGEPDFVSANDAWFMPVVQKTGPDGCLYILDWYDRYHCYQDARRDPDGIDRLKGRLYRIRYKNTPHAKAFDLSKESDEQLVQRLHSPNVYFRDIAQRLLFERNTPQTRKLLTELVLDESAPRKARMHGLWSLVSTGSLDSTFHAKLLEHKDQAYRAWGVRAAGNFGKVDPAIRDKVVSLARDPSRDVQLQVAIAAKKIDGVDPYPVWLEVLAACGDDKVIPVIVWQNLHPMLDTQTPQFLSVIEGIDLAKSGRLPELLPRVVDKVLSNRTLPPKSAVTLLRIALHGKEASAKAVPLCLRILATKIQDGEVAQAELPRLREQLGGILFELRTSKDSPLRIDATLLAATLRDEKAMADVRNLLTTGTSREEERLRALDALIVSEDPSLEKTVPTLLQRQAGSEDFRGKVLASLGKLDDAWVATVVLTAYPEMGSSLKPRAIELVTQRAVWAKQMLAAIDAKRVSPSALNATQILRLLASKDKEIVERVKNHWGTVREGRNPQREKVVAEMRTLLRRSRGNPIEGKKVFKGLCAQCHKMHDEGEEVGPDITGNGRATFEQLLSNVFDPNLVIGAAYQSVTVVTLKGRVLTGLVVEDSPQRIILKLQGGKLETIPREEVDEHFVSKVSLMPENVETQLKPKQIADLFAYLVLDKPPTDPKAKKIPGAP